MKIYCSCCDKVQPVRIDNCRDAKTNEPFQDIVCAECDLVIASGTGIDSPASKPLTDAQIGAVAADIWGSVLIAPQSYQAFARAIEAAHGIKEKRND